MWLGLLNSPEWCFVFYNGPHIFSGRHVWIAGRRVLYMNSSAGVSRCCNTCRTWQCCPISGYNSNVSSMPTILPLLWKSQKIVWSGTREFFLIQDWLKNISGCPLESLARRIPLAGGTRVVCLTSGARRGDSGGGGAARCWAPLRLLNYPPCQAECGSHPAEVISLVLNLVNTG